MKFWVTITLIIGTFMVFAIFAGRKTTTDGTIAQPTSSLAAMVGKPALDFTLQSLKGQTFSLSSLRGKKVVLFFNEGIMCYPACWNQMAALGTDSKLNNANVVSASIVVDSKDEWTSAIRKMPALGKGTILLDSDASVSNLYNMLSLPSSMHRGIKPGHTYVIIDQNGIVRFTKDDPSMGINNNILESEVAKI